MKTDDIRTSFLEFFREREHVVYPGDSLVPSHDPSLLFTGAGMNQFKDSFLGKGKLGFRRAATAQKCLRTADIDNVGRTPTHHTLFEMMGNFSFGDYFKREAILWAWEWVTGVMGLSADRLSVSVYEDDDESFEIWEREVGVRKDRIYRFDEHENFWPADAPSSSPAGTLCGPCTEIFYDRGREVGCRRAECNPSCDCPRFVEIWNLVLQEFEKGEKPKELRPLRMKNIDTGLGLERMAAVMQGVDSNFGIDILSPLVRQVLDVSRPPEEADVTRAARRIADHGRAVTFAIADGVLPSNEGRGYVVRRLLRRAVLDGRNLGIDEAFLYSLVPTVASLMGGAYPEVVDRREVVASFVKGEEENFRSTLSAGLAQLEKFAAGLSQGKVMHGEDAFTLYDTYGFPVELTREILAARGVGVDMEGFERELERARERSRGGSAMSADLFGYPYVLQVKDITKATEFVGYDADECEGEVLAVVSGEKDEGKLVESANERADKVQLILDRTVFYAEAGGQVADTGLIEWTGGEFVVDDVQKVDDVFFHIGTVKKGEVKRGIQVKCRIHSERKRAIERNHTATHLLHHALRDILGKHVEQSGSLVEPERLRLDFSHPTAVRPEELESIERMVNELIRADMPVATSIMKIEEARARGAIALFGEKYGERVRLVETGDVSKELCGGAHLRRTGEAGYFRIVSEGSVAAGVRRIEAVTGSAAFEAALADKKALDEIGTALKARRGEVVERMSGLLKRTRALEKEIEKARKAALAGGAQTREHEVEGLKVMVVDAGEASAKDLRSSGEALKGRLGEGVLVVGGRDNARAALVCWATPEAVKKGVKAGDLAKKLAEIVGGGGGGRPAMAQAGGKNAEKVPDALDQAPELVRDLLKP